MTLKGWRVVKPQHNQSKKNQRDHYFARHCLPRLHLEFRRTGLYTKCKPGSKAALRCVSLGFTMSLKRRTFSLNVRFLKLTMIVVCEASDVNMLKHCHQSFNLARVIFATPIFNKFTTKVGLYEGALGPHTLLFLLIVISKFRLTISKFRLIISKFQHDISSWFFRLNNAKFRLNNAKFRLNILKFPLIISKFQHDISSWFFVCNSTPGNLVRGSRWLYKMNVFGLLI